MAPEKMSPEKRHPEEMALCKFGKNGTLFILWIAPIYGETDCNLS